MASLQVESLDAEDETMQNCGQVNFKCYDSKKNIINVFIPEKIIISESKLIKAIRDGDSEGEILIDAVKHNCDEFLINKIKSWCEFYNLKEKTPVSEVITLKYFSDIHKISGEQEFWQHFTRDLTSKQLAILVKFLHYIDMSRIEHVHGKNCTGMSEDICILIAFIIKGKDNNKIDNYFKTDNMSVEYPIVD